MKQYIMDEKCKMAEDNMRIILALKGLKQDIGGARYSKELYPPIPNEDYKKINNFLMKNFGYPLARITADTMRKRVQNNIWALYYWFEAFKEDIKNY